MIHGKPRPRKTLTEFDPVTLPMALSAVSSARIASTEAKVSGREVPSATTVKAVTVSLSPTRHPKMEARSPIMAVTTPISASATEKHAQPPQMFGGGTIAATSFHPMLSQCMTQSTTEASPRSPPAFTLIAWRNCSDHVGISSSPSRSSDLFGLNTTLTSAVCASWPSTTPPPSSTSTTSTRKRTDLSSGLSFAGSSKGHSRILTCFDASYGCHVSTSPSTGW
mmetsp:Transcript_26483/g.53129  ORF Transcript_26483/g.53129 Transcript_26483/m.53129 type:complete len:223 (-) Transcript_26483:800-1468(-)